jgi:ferrous iron transport protein B
MHQHHGSARPVAEGKRQIVLIGNPNVGKSVVFSCLTGRYATVSNYPGTTVEITSGTYQGDGGEVVIDTPGVNSLIPHSEDERVTRDILLEEGERVVVQVADAKNLRRALMVSSQLAEIEVPFVLDVNMSDEAQQKGIELDVERLSQRLGVPVVETVAVKRQGISRLRETLGQARPSSFLVHYDADTELVVAGVEALLPPLPIGRRGAALMILSGDDNFLRWLSPRMSPQALQALSKIRGELQSRRAEPLGYLISQQRAEAADRVLREATSAGRSGGASVADFLGRMSMHPWAGVPILLLILFLIFELVGVFGAGVVVDFVESVVFGQYINPWATRFFALIPLPLLQELMVGKYGLITMGLTYAIAIVLPIMFFFFLAFGALEDAGYLPRLAIMANKVFKAIGLSGQAVLPMVLGLGCDTMATLTTRTLGSRRERVITTLLLALGVPCSAQLGVILGMMAGVSLAASALLVGVILSQLLLVGFLASKVLPGRSSDFILEVPPLRLPRFSNVLVKTVSHVEWFVREAIPLFLLGTLLLFVADKVGFLALLERWGSPIVTGFLGLPAQATQSFILGFLRRDYGAAGFFTLSQQGLLDTTQVLVALVTITLFVPCIANFFVIIKERGLRTALAIVGFIFPFAVLVGGSLNFVLRAWGVSL